MLDTKGGGWDSCVSVEHMTMLVLDEADRMLDMGFEVGERERERASERERKRERASVRNPSMRREPV